MLLSFTWDGERCQGIPCTGSQTEYKYIQDLKLRIPIKHIDVTLHNSAEWEFHLYSGYFFFYNITSICAHRNKQTNKINTQINQSFSQKVGALQSLALRVQVRQKLGREEQVKVPTVSLGQNCFGQGFLQHMKQNSLWKLATAAGQI